jgi:tetratricopeptide (TPR) repeat protein
MHVHQTRLQLSTLAIVLILAATHAGAAPDGRTAEAQAKYESGLAHFNLQEYAEAIADFEAGYRLKPNATFLYNIAQAYRLSDRPERALYFYRAYLRSAPHSSNRAEIEERIASAEALLRERKKVATTPPDHTLSPQGQPTAPTAPAATAPTTPASVATAPTPPAATTPSAAAPEPEAAPLAATETKRDRKPVYKSWWLWTTVGVVVAGGAVGLAVGLTSHGSGFSTSIPDLGPGMHSSLTVRF